MRLGEHEIDNDSDGANPEEFTIERIKIHEDYNSRTYDNDIAIITLNGTVEFSSHISPVCLPSLEVGGEAVAKSKFTNDFPFVAGWGSTRFRGETSNKLLEIWLSVQDNEKCAQSFSEVRNVAITDSKLCAFDMRENKDACQGDSGGPLMAPTGTDGFNLAGADWFQIGIVSFGYRCAEPGFPGVYTRLTEFTDWIEQEVRHGP